MRALLRLTIETDDVDIFDENSIESKYTNPTKNPEYKKVIERLFLEVGFAPITMEYDWYGQSFGDIEDKFEEMRGKMKDKAEMKGENKPNFSHEIVRIFEQVPSDIRTFELSRLCFMGYIGDGQASFVVTAVNPRQLHVRIHSVVLVRIKRACTQFKNSIETPARKTYTSPLKIAPQISVMEHQRDYPTIVGEILKKPRKDAIEQNKNSWYLFLFGVAFIIIVAALTFFLPPPVNDVKEQAKRFHLSDFTLGRLFPAIIIFLTSSGMPIWISYKKFKKEFPILWKDIQ